MKWIVKPIPQNEVYTIMCECQHRTNLIQNGYQFHTIESYDTKVPNPIDATRFIVIKPIYKNTHVGIEIICYKDARYEVFGATIRTRIADTEVEMKIKETRASSLSALAEKIADILEQDSLDIQLDYILPIMPDVKFNGKKWDYCIHTPRGVAAWPRTNPHANPHSVASRSNVLGYS